jgi:hypothetical protein
LQDLRQPAVNEDVQSITSDDTTSDDLNNYLTESLESFQRVSTYDESNSTIHQQELKAMKAEVERQEQANEQLRIQLDAAIEEQERYTTDASVRTVEQEKRMAELTERINQMCIEQMKNEMETAKHRKIESALKSIGYEKIEVDIIHDYLTPKFQQIVDHLRTIPTQISQYPTDRIPKMSFQETANAYKVIISGFQEHHDTFKKIITCIRKLVSLKQGAIRFYQQKLNRKITLINKNMARVKQRTSLWRQYSKSLLQLLNDKSSEFTKTFVDDIQIASKSLSFYCISNDPLTIRNRIRERTNQFINDHSMITEIETCKHQAFEEFMKQNIFLQRSYHDKKPSNQSAQVLEQLIQKVRHTFSTHPSFVGHQVKQFNLIPDVLQQVITYHCCFNIQLPLFESAIELLDKIEQNTVTAIATSTGSGKIRSAILVRSY